jgi:DNA polymerase
MTVFYDFETRGDVDLRTGGTYRYADTAEAIVLALALDDEPVEVIAAGGRQLAYGDLPLRFREAFERGDAFVSWNTFDRPIWNYALLDAPFMPPAQSRDAMASASAHNLPTGLDHCAKRLGLPGKQGDGKALIELFCVGRADPAEHPDEWRSFLSYAGIDVVQLRAVWKLLRPLPDSEWAVFAANEAINDRGIPVDLLFAERAAALAAREEKRINSRLAAITGGEITTVHQHIRIAHFAFGRLPIEGRKLLITEIVEQEDADDTGVERMDPEVKLSVQRAIVGRVLAYMERVEVDDPVLREVLELHEFGASAAPKKFRAMMAQHVGGRLRGQLVFNGAGQTGRFSGKGVQPQNLTRATLGDGPGDDYGTFEAPTVDLITDGCSLGELAAHGLGEVPAKKLSLLVRAAVMAPIGRTLLKADYAQIEARMLPFLAGSRSAQAVLDDFAAVDADPSLPDLYVRTAARMMRLNTPDEVSKADRQKGKVAVLACGFQGHIGAILSMGANYNFYPTDEEAAAIADQWRAANPWAPAFWGRRTRDESFGLIGAAHDAIERPNKAFRVGRVAMLYIPRAFGGSLIMRLPSGRLLTYPSCAVREYQVKNRRSGELEVRRGLTFRRAYGLSSLYGGRLAENATQAAAADLLRDALVRLDGRLDTIMHAHDEVVVECDEDKVEATRAVLVEAMTYDRPWAAGLPLAVDVSERFYYSAAKQRR